MSVEQILNDGALLLAIKTKIMQLLQDTIFSDPECTEISIMEDDYGINFSGIASNYNDRWNIIEKEKVESKVEEGIKISLERYKVVTMYVCRDNREVDIEYDLLEDIGLSNEEIPGIYYVGYDN